MPFLSRTKALLGLGVAFAILLALAGPATAVPIGDVDLTGAGALWDADTAQTACDLTGYTPVNDGEFDDGTFQGDDATDVGLVLGVKGMGWDDPDGNGARTGQQLRVGPRTIAGFKITRVDRALQTSPTLRSLIRIKNGRDRAVSRRMVLNTNLGSDSDTIVEATSSGNLVFTERDRWVVTSDDDDLDADPPFTHVLFGRRAAVEVRGVVEAPGLGNDCLEVSYQVRVPANSTRYLILFAEMHASAEDAISDAAKFNRVGLNNALLRGVRGGVRSRVLNWNL